MFLCFWVLNRIWTSGWDSKTGLGREKQTSSLLVWWGVARNLKRVSNQSSHCTKRLHNWRLFEKTKLTESGCPNKSNPREDSNILKEDSKNALEMICVRMQHAGAEVPFNVQGGQEKVKFQSFYVFIYWERARLSYYRWWWWGRQEIYSLKPSSVWFHFIFHGAESEPAVDYLGLKKSRHNPLFPINFFSSFFKIQSRQSEQRLQIVPSHIKMLNPCSLLFHRDINHWLWPQELYINTKIKS